MPKLTIDGKEIEVPAGTPIIEAASKLGINIPRYCYHEALPVTRLATEVAACVAVSAGWACAPAVTAALTDGSTVGASVTAAGAQPPITSRTASEGAASERSICEV